LLLDDTVLLGDTVLLIIFYLGDMVLHGITQVKMMSNTVSPSNTVASSNTMSPR
jgi:hypothetical protein